MRSFTAEERSALLEAMDAGEGCPPCPACGAVLSRRRVPPSDQVSYVRRRVWLLCTSCRRSGAVDLPESLSG